MNALTCTAMKRYEPKNILLVVSPLNVAVNMIGVVKPMKNILVLVSKLNLVKETF